MPDDTCFHDHAPGAGNKALAGHRNGRAATPAKARSAGFPGPGLQPSRFSGLVENHARKAQISRTPTIPGRFQMRLKWFVHVFRRFLLTATVYGNEQGCLMRKPVNCRDVLKRGKPGIHTPRQKRSARSHREGMDARRAETDTGSACDSPARGYAGTPKPESLARTGHMRKQVLTYRERHGKRCLSH